MKCLFPAVNVLLTTSPAANSCVRHQNLNRALVLTLGTKWNQKTHQPCLTHRVCFSVDANDPKSTLLSEGPCPQGVQGEDNVTFKHWLENCQRYGLANCNEQLQGVQSGKKTLAEIMAEQEKLIAEIAAQYQASSRRGEPQGVQDSVHGSSHVDFPCPQGVQGDNCAHFKVWLENCHSYGFQDCSQQFENIRTGRKSLAQVFAEQERMILAAAAVVSHQNFQQQTRSYSTSPKVAETSRQPSSDRAETEAGQGVPKTEAEATPNSPPDVAEVPLTQRQKLKRAVKEYGSTVIVFHVTISLCSLGFFYLLVSSGIDIVGILMKLGIGSELLQNKLAAGTGTFVVAYAVHKVFAPVRIATTLTATPLIVRYLRRIGFLKVPQSAKSG